MILVDSSVRLPGDNFIEIGEQMSGWAECNEAQQLSEPLMLGFAMAHRIYKIAVQVTNSSSIFDLLLIYPEFKN